MKIYLYRPFGRDVLIISSQIGEECIPPNFEDISVQTFCKLCVNIPLPADDDKSPTFYTHIVFANNHVNMSLAIVNITSACLY